MHVMVMCDGGKFKKHSPSHCCNTLPAYLQEIFEKDEHFSGWQADSEKYYVAHFKYEPGSGEDVDTNSLTVQIGQRIESDLKDRSAGKEVTVRARPFGNLKVRLEPQFDEPVFIDITQLQTITDGCDSHRQTGRESRLGNAVRSSLWRAEQENYHDHCQCLAPNSEHVFASDVCVRVQQPLRSYVEASSEGEKGSVEARPFGKVKVIVSPVDPKDSQSRRLKIICDGRKFKNNKPSSFETFTDYLQDRLGKDTHFSRWEGKGVAPFAAECSFTPSDGEDVDVSDIEVRIRQLIESDDTICPAGKKGGAKIRQKCTMQDASQDFPKLCKAGPGRCPPGLCPHCNADVQGSKWNQMGGTMKLPR